MRPRSSANGIGSIRKTSVTREKEMDVNLFKVTGSDCDDRQKANGNGSDRTSDTFSINRSESTSSGDDGVDCFGYPIHDLQVDANSVAVEEPGEQPHPQQQHEGQRRAYSNSKGLPPSPKDSPPLNSYRNSDGENDSPTATAATPTSRRRGSLDGAGTAAAFRRHQTTSNNGCDGPGRRKSLGDGLGEKQKESTPKTPISARRRISAARRKSLQDHNAAQPVQDASLMVSPKTNENNHNKTPKSSGRRTSHRRKSLGDSGMAQGLEEAPNLVDLGYEEQPLKAATASGGAHQKSKRRSNRSQRRSSLGDQGLHRALKDGVKENMLAQEQPNHHHSSSQLNDFYSSSSPNLKYIHHGTGRRGSLGDSNHCLTLNRALKEDYQAKFRARMHASFSNDNPRSGRRSSLGGGLDLEGDDCYDKNQSALSPKKSSSHRKARGNITRRRNSLAGGGVLELKHDDSKCNLHTSSGESGSSRRNAGLPRRQLKQLMHQMDQQQETGHRNGNDTAAATPAYSELYGSSPELFGSYTSLGRRKTRRNSLTFFNKETGGYDDESDNQEEMPETIGHSAGQDFEDKGVSSIRKEEYHKHRHQHQKSSNHAASTGRRNSDQRFEAFQKYQLQEATKVGPTPPLLKPTSYRSRRRRSMEAA